MLGLKLNHASKGGYWFRRPPHLLPFAILRSGSTRIPGGDDSTSWDYPGTGHKQRLYIKRILQEDARCDLFLSPEMHCAFDSKNYMKCNNIPSIQFITLYVWSYILSTGATHKPRFRQSDRQHIEVGTKWPPFCWRHFQMHFIDLKMNWFWLKFHGYLFLEFH